MAGTGEKGRERERGRERRGVDPSPREARLDAAPEGLSVTNDHGAMHTQTDRRPNDEGERERGKKNIY